MVWQSKISTDEANELIAIMSENVREGLLSRTAVESQLFPVSTYISVACYQLYDQSFQYNVVKDMIKNGGCDPRKIGPKCKTPGAILNGLAFQAFAMLYLQGRLQCIYDLGGPQHETEEKKEETKFLLDFFRNLNPNYRNDGLLLVDHSEDRNMHVIDKNLVETLRGDMFKPNKEQIRKFRRIVALIMNYAFLDKCECRAGVFEHGPYKLDTGEFLLFKEFQFIINRIKGSPIPNLILAYSLKDMNSLKFNDWGTLFADPSDFSNNITAMGMWTHKFLMPKDIKYPTRLGRNSPISWETFEKVGQYSQKALKELYIKVAKWDYNRRCLAGVNIYTKWLLVFALFAKLPKLNLEVTEKTRSYIPIFRNYPEGFHPSFERFYRSDKERKEDPTYYYIIE